MIGVAACAEDLETAREFFELFKTAWEPALPRKRYSVLLSTGGSIDDYDSDLVLMYSGRAEPIDREAGVQVSAAAGPVDVRWHSDTFPVYAQVALFERGGATTTAFVDSSALDFQFRCGNRSIRRIGFNIFSEVRRLLTEGQPQACAMSPTLDLHIAWLRSTLLDAGVSFVEVPPRPLGAEYVCCLTHDLDFFGIRRHRFDWTLAGFVARASIGTLVDLFRSRRALADALRNWVAVAKLPFVLVGLARDPWHPVRDYAAVEAADRSTFFVIPFKNRCGVSPAGTVHRLRAVKYEAREVRDALRDAAQCGSEIAVHGIDAWRDVDAGREELGQVMAITGTDAGVRMHWLYFETDSPAKIESAGYRYDSSCGYNDAVGYRAGTGQVFRLPRAQRLLELPLSIMDSALFYERRLGLSPAEATDVCRRIVANARRFGGTLVINWHDRSLAPERLWGAAYARLLADVEGDGGAWFATAGKAVAWFGWRRSITFAARSEGQMCVTGAVRPAAVPGARVLVYRRDRSVEESAFDGSEPKRVQL